MTHSFTFCLLHATEITVLPCYFTVWYSSCVMSFTAVFYEFVQLSQVILPSASGTLPLSASLWCGGLILHGGLLKQTQSPNSCNMQKLSADQSLLVLNIKDFSALFLLVFFFCDALILLICVFLYVNLYVSARIVSRIYFNQDILFKKLTT